MSVVTWFDVMIYVTWVRRTYFEYVEMEWFSKKIMQFNVKQYYFSIHYSLQDVSSCIIYVNNQMDFGKENHCFLTRFEFGGGFYIRK